MKAEYMLHGPKKKKTPQRFSCVDLLFPRTQQIPPISAPNFPNLSKVDVAFFFQIWQCLPKATIHPKFKFTTQRTQTKTTNTNDNHNHESHKKTNTNPPISPTHLY